MQMMRAACAAVILAGCAPDDPQPLLLDEDTGAPLPAEAPPMELHRIDCAALPPVDAPWVRGGYNDHAVIEVPAPIASYRFEPGATVRAAIFSQVTEEARAWIEANNPEGYPQPPDRWTQSFAIDEDGHAIATCLWLAATPPEDLDGPRVGWISTVELRVGGR